MEEISQPNKVAKSYGDLWVRKSRRKRQKLLITELFFDYSNNTTLHGIPYFTKRGLTIIEKIFWMITCLISIIWCCYSIYQLYVRWRTSPVIVTISEHEVSVGTVPFPSVTICPQVKIVSKTYNYTTKYLELDLSNSSILESSLIEKVYKFNDVNQICGPYVDDLTFALPRSNRRNSTNASVIDTIFDISPSKIFFGCRWRGKHFKCLNRFKTVLTSEGVCYTANSLAYHEIFWENAVSRPVQRLAINESSRHWSIEHGYTNTTDDPYPRIGVENANSPDLEVILVENKKTSDHLCNGQNSGFKIFIHHPADLPQSSLYYYAAINKQLSSVALSFNIFNTSDSLRSYDPTTRQCYFPDERPLKYFKHYTANNCWMECFSNYTYNECKCVAFYMPHNNSDEICADEKLYCVEEAQEELTSQETTAHKSCDCLPACVSIDYQAEILKTEFNFQELSESYRELYNPNYKKGINKHKMYSKIEIFYKKPRFLSMRRSELFGTTEFLANVGGLLGLFMGFSFLSLTELMFYCTLRLMCILKKDLKEEKKRAKIRILPEKF